MNPVAAGMSPVAGVRPGFRGWWVLAGLAGLVAVAGLWVSSSYNGLVRLDQAAQSQWAQVENTYQRRADLVPNLVATVKGAADFEKGTFTAVAEARAQVGKLPPGTLKALGTDPAAFERFQKAQDELTTSLSRLLVVAEQYPQLKATENFRDLQAQLEGSENRITVERMRFNEAAQAFNSSRSAFPTVLIAGFAGHRFDDKPYFHAVSGTERPPTVNF